MDLNLREKLTDDEILEIKKRVFSFVDQMFLEGISVGRELDKEEIFDSTEQYIRDQLSTMTEYFIRDDIWTAMPPQGYNADPNIPISQPDTLTEENFENEIAVAKNPNGFINDGGTHNIGMDNMDTMDTMDDAIGCCGEEIPTPINDDDLELPAWVHDMHKTGKAPFPT